MSLLFIICPKYNLQFYTTADFERHVFIAIIFRQIAQWAEKLENEPYLLLQGKMFSRTDESDVTNERSLNLTYTVSGSETST